MALAKPEDVAARLGRELDDEETTAVGFLLDAATAVVEEAIEGPADDPAPPVLRFVAVEVVVRALANPNGLASRSETLGAYSHSEAFLSGAGLMLTKTEELMVRRAALGAVAGSVAIPSHVDDIFDALVGS